MTKQEQIKEITQIIYRRSKDNICLIDKYPCDCNCGWARYAEVIYNEWCRKVDEIRKETEKEILQKVINICRKEIDFQDGTKNTQLAHLYVGIISGCDFIKYKVKEIAKEYGVEMEE